jgi:protein tyrosine phosphatase
VRPGFESRTRNYFETTTLLCISFLMSVEAYWEGGNVIESEYAPEMFIVTPMPNNLRQYWCSIWNSEVDFGFQLEDRFPEYAYTLDECPNEKVDVGMGLSVTLVQVEKILSGVTKRTCILRDSQESPERKYVHFQIAWPDFSVVDSKILESVFKVYDELVEVKRSESSERKPRTHVHCLAGRGRSGTLVYSRILSCIIDEEKDDELFDEVLFHIRSQRRGLCETDEQKKFARTFFGKAMQWRKSENEPKNS